MQCHWRNSSLKTLKLFPSNEYKKCMKTLKVLAVICMLGAASCAEKNGQTNETNVDTTSCDSMACDSTECDSTATDTTVNVEVETPAN